MDRIPVEARFSATFQTGLQAHPASSMGLFPESKAVGAWRSPLTPIYCPSQRKGRGIIVLPLWAFVTCSRVNFAVLPIFQALSCFLMSKHASLHPVKNSFVLCSALMSEINFLTQSNIYIYTECPRRNVPDFGRVFLMLKYTDITQNTYVHS